MHLPTTDEDSEESTRLIHKRGLSHTGGGSHHVDIDSGDGFSSGGEEYTVLRMASGVLTGSWLNVLLICVPLSFVARYLDWPLTWPFVFAMLGIIPLSLMLGDATEEIALRTGPIVGGLLNATFSNAVELIVAITALRAGLVRIVQTSLLGSVMSNMLLVMGCSFFFGNGLTLKFNQSTASININMLLLFTMIVVLPVSFSKLTPEPADPSEIITVSHYCAIALFLVYVCFLVLQLRTHRFLFESDDGEEETPTMTLSFSVVLLLVVTALVTYEADCIIDAVEYVAEHHSLTHSFIGIILIPLVGNAAEHVACIQMARRSKMDLALNVVMGSCTQIGAFVLPVCVLIGWIIGVPMSLSFEALDAVVFMVSMFITSNILRDGSTNWFEGACLCAAYFVVSLLYFHIK